MSDRKLEELEATGGLTESEPDWATKQRQQEEQRKADAQRAHREAVRTGKIDIGPITEHGPITEDIRDMRDPQAHGEALLARAASPMRDTVEEGWIPLSVLADMLDTLEGRESIAKTPSHQSSVEYTKAKRLAELEERVAVGDKFAVDLLEAHKKGIPESQVVQEPAE